MGTIHRLEASDSKFVVNPALHLVGAEAQVPMVRKAEERLPFSVSIVRDEEKLHKAVAIRHAAYARHMPDFAETLRSPEAYDHEPGSVVLLAESRLDGSPIGTMRIQTNRFSDLMLQKSAELPNWLADRSMAEATRLGIAEGRVGRVAKVAMFKALYLYCVEAGIDYMCIAARPPVDRQYEALLFEDVFPGKFFPLKHANNIPHRVLAFEVATAEARWTEANHPLLQFMTKTNHPDIDLSNGDYSVWGRRERHVDRRVRESVSA